MACAVPIWSYSVKMLKLFDKSIHQLNFADCRRRHLAMWKALPGSSTCPTSATSTSCWKTPLLHAKSCRKRVSVHCFWRYPFWWIFWYWLFGAHFCQDLHFTSFYRKILTHSPAGKVMEKRWKKYPTSPRKTTEKKTKFIVFQPSMFRGELLVFRRYHPNKWPKINGFSL